LLLVIRDQIITTLMGSTSGRVPAPRPRSSPASYQKDFVPLQEGEPVGTILAAFEPLFDAAEVIECRCSPLRLADLRGRPRRQGGTCVRRSKAAWGRLGW
jgi:hypothetical protein